jgi:hypothetical protein
MARLARQGARADADAGQGGVPARFEGNAEDQIRVGWGVQPAVVLDVAIAFRISTEAVRAMPSWTSSVPSSS